MKSRVFSRPSFSVSSHIFLVATLLSVSSSGLRAMATTSTICTPNTTCEVPWYAIKIETITGLASETFRYPRRLFHAIKRLEEAQTKTDSNYHCQRIIILGPHGCGKTTLAKKIAAESKSTLLELSDPLSNNQKTKDLIASVEEITSSGKTVVILLSNIKKYQTEPGIIVKDSNDTKLQNDLDLIKENLEARQKFWGCLDSIKNNPRTMVILETESMENLGIDFAKRFKAFPIEQLSLPCESSRFTLLEQLWRKFHGWMKQGPNETTLSYQHRSSHLKAFLNKIAHKSNGLSCEEIEKEFSCAHEMTNNHFKKDYKNCLLVTEHEAWINKLEKNYIGIIVKRQLLSSITASAKMKSCLTNMLAAAPSEKQVTTFLLGATSTLLLVNYEESKKKAKKETEKKKEQEASAQETTITA